MKVFCSDWDDSLVDARTQEWLPDAEWALSRLLHAGVKVIVLSCRASWPEGRASIEAKIEEARLGRIKVTDVKPVADWYADDKAVVIKRGGWPDIVRSVCA